MKRKAVVLLSGGIDSTTTLYLAKEHKFKCFCLIFDYGQRHKKEIKLAKKIAKLANCQYKVLKINLPWKGSALLDRKLKVPKRRSLKEISSGIPSTYVPSRNTIFLSFAASFAESIGASKIFIGANIIDYSGYPDCRPKYIDSFNSTLKSGTQAKNIRVEAPLIKKSKTEIVKLGYKLNIPFKFTWSCYEGKRKPCRVCDSCKIRSKSFENARVIDPWTIK